MASGRHSVRTFLEKRSSPPSEFLVLSPDHPFCITILLTPDSLNLRSWILLPPTLFLASLC
ncbi:hypothetical protein L208DRAFT_517314 [Tricholoma matsutake]|nr:hypothetical protein L208DRAFT_517314 [Tricholoma matsutake 945]